MGGTLFQNGGHHKGANLAAYLYLLRPAKMKWNALQQQILHWQWTLRITTGFILWYVMIENARICSYDGIVLMDCSDCAMEDM